MRGNAGTVLWALVAAVTCAACDSNPRSETAEPRAAEPAPAVVQVDVGRPLRGRMVGGASMRRIVAWPPAAERDDAARNTMSLQARASIDAAPVPVLVPADPMLVQSAVVTSGPHWAAVSMQIDGLHVSLHVSGQAKVYAHIKPVAATHTVRGFDGFVTRNEGVWVAAWIEHGVAYDLELECADQSAAACSNADALMAYADSLHFVGGQGVSP